MPAQSSENKAVNERMLQFDPLKCDPGWAKGEEEERGGWEVSTKGPHTSGAVQAHCIPGNETGPRGGAASTRPGWPLPGAWGAAGHGGTERPAVYSEVSPQVCRHEHWSELWAPFWERDKI